MHSWILLSLAALAAFSAASGAGLKCTKPMDILFLVDKSASIKPNQWKIQKEFVRKLIARFEVGAHQMRASVTLFAIKAREQFCFGKYITAAALDGAVAGLSCKKCKKGKTGTGDALRWGRQKSFKARCGHQPNAAKIVVVLTDGKSTEKAKFFKNQAKMMKKHAGHVIAIGVGPAKKVDVKELRLIASAESLVFTSNSHDALFGIVDKIADSICEVVKPVPVQPTLIGAPAAPVKSGTPIKLTCLHKSKMLSTFTFFKDGDEIQSGPSSFLSIAAADGDHVGTYTCAITIKGEKSAESHEQKIRVMGVCSVPLDLLLLVDKSASIKPHQFVLAKQFLEKMVDSFHISATGVHVSLVLFAIGPHEKFCFDEYTHKEPIKQAIAALECKECLRGKTGTGSALQHGREKSFTERCGMRPDVKKIVVVLTDGRSTEEKSYLETQTRLMKETGAQVITVGVGQIKKSELEMIATSNDQVFMANDFNKLQGMLEIISKKSCELGM